MISLIRHGRSRRAFPPRARHRRRGRQLEWLEQRQLLAGDWQNAFNRFDVNNDALVAQQDALVAINELNGRNLVDAEGQLPDRSAHPTSPLYDVNGDGFLAPLDVLPIINAMLGDASGPVVTASLLNDTAPFGGTNTDLVTSDGRIVGTVVDDATGVSSLRVSVNGGPMLTLSRTRTDTPRTLSFSFDPEIATDGVHQLRFEAVDARTNESTDYTFTFQVDTVPGSSPTFDLSIGSDTPELGDQQTTAQRVTLVGHSDPLAFLSLGDNGPVTRANGQGVFQFTDVALSLGENAFQVLSSDAAGNEQTGTATFTRNEDSAEEDVVITWNQIALEAIRRDAATPLYASRSLAIVSAAVYDTVNSLEGVGGQFVSVAAPPGASLTAAVAAAAHQALTQLFPAQSATFDAALATSLAMVPDGPQETDGESVGRQVAERILQWRANDGSRDFAVFEGGLEPGEWRPTLPNFDPALSPQWVDVLPFLIEDAFAYLPSGPPELTSTEYAVDVNQVQELGRVDSATRTADQTEIARFWADGIGTYTPPGHWNQIAQTVAHDHQNSTSANARLFAMLNLAMADAGTVAWLAKYSEALWRPITAIRAADLDGNNATAPDPTWSPLLPTPPFPSYVSGHSAFSGAAAEVLSAIFGDNVTFSDSSVGLPGVTRQFTSFDQAADEAGISRIYGGIHYLFDSLDGLTSGHSVGQRVVSAFSGVDLQPPIVLVTQPASGAAVSDDPVIEGVVNEAISGIATFTVEIDGGDPMSIDLDDSGQFLLDSLDLADGQHDFLFRAVDHSGNASPPLLYVLTVDRSPPAITIDSPLPDEILTTSSSLNGIADPTGSSLVSLRYRFNDGPLFPLSFDPVTGVFAAPLPLHDLAAGFHELSLVAVDAAGHESVRTVSVELDANAPFEVQAVLPLDGSVEVGLTYRPKVTFSRAVDASSLSDDNLFLSFSGEKIPATIIPSSDGLHALLFPQGELPGAAEITVTVDGSTIVDLAGTPLDAALTGLPGSLLQYGFSTVSTSGLPGTSLAGIVADPGLDLRPMSRDDIRPGPDGLLNTGDDIYLNPIAGVRVFVIGQESRAVTTDAEGRFQLDGIPAGDVKLVVNGLTATNAPAGFYFPEMVMDLRIRPGQVNTAFGTMGEVEKAAALEAVRGVYLPRLASSLLQTVDNAVGLTMGINSESAPDLTPEQREQYRLEIPPNSLVGHDGQPLSSAQIGISTVPPELVREMLPPGIMQLSATLTLQAPDVALFTAPVPLTVPNIYGGAPGSKMNFYSFNHTTGLLEITGTATVSPDGLSATSDPGSGVPYPGWFGMSPGSDCEECQEDIEGSGEGPDEDDGNDTSTDNSDGESGAEGEPAVPASGTKEFLRWSNLEDHFFASDNEVIKTLRLENLEKDKKKSDKKLIVVVTMDGPFSSFLTGNLPKIVNKPQVLCPGQSLNITINPKQLLATVTKLTKDQLFGLQIQIKVYKQQVGGQQLLDKRINLMRLLPVVDPRAVIDRGHEYLTAFFMKTLADGGGGFTREKEVDYNLPKKIPVKFTAGGGDSAAFRLNQALLGKGTVQWTFEPSSSKFYEGKFTPKMGGRSFSKILTTFGTGVTATTASVGVNSLVIALRTYLNNNAPGASAAFRTAFQGFLPADNPTPTAVTMKVTQVANDMLTAVQGDYTGANMNGGHGITVQAEGGSISGSWQIPIINCDGVLAVGCAGLDVDKTTADRQKWFTSAVVSEAAREWTFGEILNLTANQPVQLSLSGMAAGYNGTRPFGEYLSYVASHEIGHTLGLQESYKRDAAAAGGFSSVSPPGDLMSLAKEVTNVNRGFAAINLNTVAAGLGMASNQAGSLATTIKVFRKNFLLPTSTAGVLTIPSEVPEAILVMTSTQSEVYPEDQLDFGKVLADGVDGQLIEEILTLTNMGDAPLTINSAALGADAQGFQLRVAIDPGTVLGSGESLELPIAFDPLVAGDARTTLTIDSTNIGGAVAIDLVGHGQTTHGQISLALREDEFTAEPNNNVGGQIVGDEPLIVQSFLTITNTGGGDLSIQDFPIIRGEGIFAVVGLPEGFSPANPILLAPGESIDVSVEFAPDRAGLRPGTVRIVSDDPGQPTLDQPILGTGISTTVMANRGRTYVAIHSPANPGAPVIRQRSDAAGNWTAVMPGNTWVDFTKFDPQSGLVAHGTNVTEAWGVTTVLSATAYHASTSPDSDGDGLPDDAEFAIGTSPFKVDTNNDGVSDFAAIEGGMDARTTGIFPTGVIAGTSVSGNALDVVLASTAANAQRTTAYVATSSGLTIVDVTQPDRPVRLGQITVTGGGQSVAFDETSNVALLAGGNQGLRIIDVADPERPVLLRTLTLPATAVQTQDGLAFVASGTSIVVVDPLTGAIIDRRTYPGQTLDDLSISNRWLYTIGRGQGTDHVVNKIAAFDLLEPAAASLVISGHPTFGRMHIFADDGLIYVGGVDNNVIQQIPGVEILRDSGDQLQVTGAPSGITAFDVTTNGAGLALFTGATPQLEQAADLGLLNVSDPAITNQVLTVYDVFGSARAVTIGSGLAFVAGNQGGLQVVNYLGADTGGEPPALDISSTIEDIDLDADGIQIFEGTDIPLEVVVSDDVQVGRVELLINGRVVAIDLAAPFEFFARAPLLADGVTSAAIQVRATDTGGNVGRSTVLTYELLPDTGPPVVTRTSPAEGSESVDVAGISVRFSEPIDVGIVGSDGVSLTRDGQTVNLRRVRAAGNGLSIVPTASLPFGEYTLTLDPSIIADRAGNHMAAASVTTFIVGTGRVIAAMPVPGSTSQIPLNQIALEFNTSLNALLPAPGDFTLVAAGPDNQFDTNDDVDVPIAALGFDRQDTRLTLQLNEFLPSGRYRLTAPAEKLQDRFGRAIDGEFTATFPSGDGQPGGDFEYEFSTAPSSTLPLDAFPARSFINFDTTQQSLQLLTPYTPILVTDLNNDQRPDVVQTVHGQYFAGFSGGQQVFNPLNQVTVLFGEEGGGFGAPLTFDVGPGAARVVAGDVNGDQIVDLVVLNNPGGINQKRSFELSVLIGTGSSFQPELRITTGQESNEPGTMVLGLLNDDQELDLAVLVPSHQFVQGMVVNRLLIFAGLGDGTFQEPAVIELSSSAPEHQLLPGDLNGDQQMDLISTHHVLMGNGDGTFNITGLAAGDTVLALDDFDGDQTLDLVTSMAVTEFDDDTGERIVDSVDVTISSGGGDGTFAAGSPIRLPLGGGFGGDDFSRFTVAVTDDLNGDMHRDLVVAAALSETSPLGNIAILLGTGSGGFSAPQLVAVYNASNRFFPATLGIGDATQDGRPDILVGVPTSNSTAPLRTAIIPNQGDGTFQAPLFNAALDRRPNEFDVRYQRIGADVNNDQQLDLVRIATRNDGETPTQLQVALGMGDGTFGPFTSATPVPLPAGFGTNVVVGDVNGDQLPDAIAWDANIRSTDGSQTNAFLLLGQAGGGFGAPVEILHDTFFLLDLELVDVNGDNHLDIVRMGSFTGLVVRLGDGNGGFSADVISNFLQTGFTEGSFVLADVNGDGTLDALNAGNNAAIGQGDGTFVRAPRPSLGLPAGAIVAVDVNGDDRLDVVGASAHSLRISLGNGDGTFQDTIPLAVPGTSAFDLQTADLNQDGVLDLILSNESELDVLLNNGDLTFEPLMRFDAPGLTRGTGGSFPNVRALFADLDGDGLLDILAATTVLLRKAGG